MKTNRSGAVKPEGEKPAVEKTSPPVAKKENPPQMGDIVLFNYRNPSAPAAITMPMVVTKVHNDLQTIDGVALNSNSTAGRMGEICAHGILPGNGEFEWRRR